MIEIILFTSKEHFMFIKFPTIIVLQKSSINIILIYNDIIIEIVIRNTYLKLIY